MLKHLPEDIFDLTMEYAKHYQNGICVKRTPNQFKFAGIPLIDKYFGIYNNRSYATSYIDDCDHILGIICDYLPIYDYNNEPSNKYGLFGVCATRGDNLVKAMDWMVKQCKKNKK